MRKMKDSGIEWIGKIPDIWRQTKLKYVTKIRSENGMYSPEQDSYIGLENIVSRSNKLIETETIYESALYSICKKGDILFNKLRPYLAKAIISPIDGFCTGELLNIKHFDGEKRFLWYYLLSDKFIEVVNASTYGAKMPRANTDFILNLPVFLPPLAEQQRIADFLDEKCGEIDSIRSDIQKQIDILNDYKKSVITEAVTKGLNPKAKLKDSGIEWIGKIPEGWDVVPIKRVLKDIKDGTHATFNRVAEGLFLLSAKNVFDDGIHIGNNESCISENDYLSIIANGFPKRNDVLLSIVGTIGRCCVYQEDKPMAFQRSVAFLRANEKILPYFLVYSLRSRATEEEEKQKINGTAQMGLYLGDVCSLRIAVPPLSEQKAIADYLDEKCSEIDATIADKQRQLETLDEYKKSLIFEYVTGKKEVLQ